MLAEAAGGGPRMCLRPRPVGRAPSSRSGMRWNGSIARARGGGAARDEAIARDLGRDRRAARAGRFFYLVGGDPGLVPKVLAARRCGTRSSRRGAAARRWQGPPPARWRWASGPRSATDARRRPAPVSAGARGGSGVAVLPHFETFGHRWVDSAQAAEPSGGVVLLASTNAARPCGGTEPGAPMAWRGDGDAAGATERFDAGASITGLPSPG